MSIETPADVSAIPSEAEVRPSGLASRVLNAGTGSEKPAAADTVTVHYSGWTTDGQLFDSSVQRGQPASFPLNRVIKGWTEGLQLMVEGEKRRFWIPAELAYGNNPAGGRPAGMLVFDVELLGMEKAPEPPKTPEDVAAVPAEADTTSTGLASRILAAGKGGETPVASSIVTVHYSGWTTAGELFDSSVMRGEPARFPLQNVIKGWTEGVQLMALGEKRRFWIPAELAYGDQPQGGAPAGMLVFDVELLDFTTPPPPPEAPEDVAGVPDNAEVRPSGLASRVLTEGTGTKHPEKSSTVTVHYSGWTTDGNLFDSSVVRGEPASFGLFQVIAGWTEGVQLMVKGETRRFWIPGKLAYGDEPQGGAPAGMLVFDVELLSIDK
ncbi:FKBP-type peptidyl-prolyl cis-trans isomerase [Coraliomargarita akajimensis]|uniref:peptidylprolyl isomerase n=1 Tax=Coraliomargarita akajimensis (strain DSM 45221 / IAM 15411 / JCM 23193 / KCTC 12865 / 04OKA010-24) TaxID=583355 RepID=D5EHU5_CORAD|nr:FKBP-type peptidyl-prolyl cis-trans isomerase [Coraliomargarita akajimensis]ADE54136.1 peptidylprolyl isomerase FKBP-type [Coraliomargarita akajimensis DSM 45221]